MSSLDIIKQMYATLYKDTMDIYRATTVFNNSDKSSSSITPETPTITNIKCRLSILDEDKGKMTQLGSPKGIQYRIFTSPEQDIQSGDEVEIKITNGQGVTLKTCRGIAGDPVPYPTHQEIHLEIMGVS